MRLPPLWPASVPRLRLVRGPRLWIVVALFAFLGGAALVVAAPWSGNSASEDPTETPEAAAATASPSASPTPTSTPTPEPTPTATARPENLFAIVYVANTGGDGVSIRAACRDDARVPGAWAEGTAVRIIEPGSDACAGWTYVVGPGEGSWVRDGYLSEDQPAVVPPPSGGGGTPPPPGSPLPGTAPMFVFGTAQPGDFVLVFAGNQFCDSTIAASGIGTWGLEVGGGSECSPASGAPLIFSVNGQVAQTSGLHSYQPSASESVTLLP